MTDCLVNDPRGHFSSTLLTISPDALLLCKGKSMSGIKPSLFFGQKKQRIAKMLCSLLQLRTVLQSKVLKRSRETRPSQNITLKKHTQGQEKILNTCDHIICCTMCILCTLCTEKRRHRAKLYSQDLAVF